MAHGIEGRFPFLDHRVFENSVATRPQDKLAGLHEKIAVRRVAAEVVPPIVAQRPKQPYRAPEAAAFFADEPEWVDRAPLARGRRAPSASTTSARVAGLVRRCRAGRATGFRENMALMGVLSTQVWHEHVRRRRTALRRGARGAARAAPSGTTRTGGERRLTLPGGGMRNRLAHDGAAGAEGSGAPEYEEQA